MRRLAKAHGPATPPPALDDAALLAELGASAQGWARDDAEAALLAQLQELGEDDEAALLRQLDGCDDDTDARLLRDIDAMADEEAVLLQQLAMRSSEEPRSIAAEVERLTAAVQSVRRKALTLKQAGHVDDARAALRASKQLQEQLDAALVEQAQAKEVVEEDPDLLAQLALMMSGTAVAACPPTALDEEGVPDEAAVARAAEARAAAPSPPAVVADARPAAAHAPAPLPESDDACAAAASDVAASAPAAPSEAPPPCLRNDVLAAKREALTLKRAGRLMEAKAALLRAKELERRLAEAGE